jgi:enoyl-CoA hydratase/carnithine racemase
MTGREVSAEEALALGLASRMVPAGMAETEALALAATIAELPPCGVMLAKRALRLQIADLDRLYPQAL